jgi:hypothetical protein
MGTCEQHDKVQFLDSPSKQEVRISLPVFMFKGRLNLYTGSYRFKNPMKSTSTQL